MALEKMNRTSFQTVASDWAFEVNGVAKEKGWWDEGLIGRTSDDMIFLMVTEIAEAFEEYRKPGLTVKEIYFAPPANQDNPELRKPEGVPVELADVIIRAFDTIAMLSTVSGGRGIIDMAALDAVEDWDGYYNSCSEHLATNFMQLLRPLCQIADYTKRVDGQSESRNNRRAIRGLLGVVVAILAMGEKMDMDLHRALVLKNDFNKTRPHRHGGKKV